MSKTIIKTCRNHKKYKKTTQTPVQITKILKTKNNIKNTTNHKNIKTTIKTKIKHKI